MSLELAELASRRQNTYQRNKAATFLASSIFNRDVWLFLRAANEQFKISSEETGDGKRIKSK